MKWLITNFIGTYTNGTHVVLSVNLEMFVPRRDSNTRKAYKPMFKNSAANNVKINIMSLIF